MPKVNKTLFVAPNGKLRNKGHIRLRFKLRVKIIFSKNTSNECLLSPLNLEASSAQIRGLFPIGFYNCY